MQGFFKKRGLFFWVITIWSALLWLTLFFTAFVFHLTKCDIPSLIIYGVFNILSVVFFEYAFHEIALVVYPPATLVLIAIIRPGLIPLKWNLIIGAVSIIGLFMARGVYEGLHKKGAVNPAPLGSARFETDVPDKHIGKVGKEFVLGWFVNQNKDGLFNDLFFHLGHMLTCAPSGAGKGVSVVIPNLLQYGGSVFCIDIKGENYAVTARQRRMMGQEIVLIDPYNVVEGEKSGFNPFDWLCSFPEDMTPDSLMIADALIVQQNDADFWNDSARDLVRALCLYVSLYPDSYDMTETKNRYTRNLGEVRRILTLPKDSFLSVMGDMQSCGNIVAERCANSMTGMDEKTRSGIVTTAIQQTSFLDDERIALALSSTGFNLPNFKTGNITVYIVLPPERLATNFRLIRLLTSLLITSVTRSKLIPENPALFMFDEFAQLGKMSLIEDTLSLIRGYGAYYWFIIQDLSQLKAVYPKWQTFLSNTSKQFFAVSDYDTAKYVSDYLGQTTVAFQTSGTSFSNSQNNSGDSNSNSESTSQHLQNRNLLNPDEVMNLSPDTVLAFIRSERPYYLERVNYLKNEAFSDLYDQNPLHRLESENTVAGMLPS